MSIFALLTLSPVHPVDAVAFNKVHMVTPTYLLKVQQEKRRVHTIFFTQMCHHLAAHSDRGSMATAPHR